MRQLRKKAGAERASGVSKSTDGEENRVYQGSSENSKTKLDSGES